METTQLKLNAFPDETLDEMFKTFRILNTRREMQLKERERQIEGIQVDIENGAWMRKIDNPKPYKKEKGVGVGRIIIRTLEQILP